MWKISNSKCNRCERGDVGKTSNKLEIGMWSYVKGTRTTYCSGNSLEQKPHHSNRASQWWKLDTCLLMKRFILIYIIYDILVLLRIINHVQINDVIHCCLIAATLNSISIPLFSSRFHYLLISLGLVVYKW